MAKTTLERIREIDAFFEQELLRGMQSVEDTGGSNQPAVEKDANKMAEILGATREEFSDYVTIQGWIYRLADETPDELIEERLTSSPEFYEQAASLLGVSPAEFVQYMRKGVQKFKKRIATGRPCDWFGERSQN